MKVDIQQLQHLVDDSLLRVQEHPYGSLYIYNYTERCQFEHLWSPETRMCRGLIVDSAGVVVARPYDKFFNLEEHDPDEIPKDVNFIAFDKADGSLGIMYPIHGGVALATRGSFISEQAIKGTEMLHEKLDKATGGIFFPEKYTYLFEIIYPENRIVVDYGGISDLVFLGAREIETGKILLPDSFPEVQKLFVSAKPVEDYKTPRDNAEGVVLYFANGFMCKVKYEEYVRLHRLVTGVNERRIWDILRNGGSVKELLEHVPEEFEKWVVDTTNRLTAQYKEIEEEAHKRYNEFIPGADTKKEFAMRVLGMKGSGKWSGLLFAIYDKKDYSGRIWKMIYPSAYKPFREDM